MNDIEVIQSKIYEIRGTKVMLDKDLAELYQVTTGRLNEAVKRNIRRFPLDFMFQVTKEEFEELKSNLISQNAISSWGGTRKLPYAFTEQGLAMLSGVLNSDIAININISIMRAFVAIRNGIAAINSNKELEDLKARIKALEEISEDTFAAINDLSEDNRKEFDDIYLALSQLATSKKQIANNPIGYKAIQKRQEKEKE